MRAEKVSAIVFMLTLTSVFSSIVAAAPVATIYHDPNQVEIIGGKLFVDSQFATSKNPAEVPQTTQEKIKLLRLAKATRSEVKIEFTDKGYGYNISLTDQEVIPHALVSDANVSKDPQKPIVSPDQVKIRIVTGKVLGLDKNPIVQIYLDGKIIGSLKLPSPYSPGISFTVRDVEWYLSQVINDAKREGKKIQIDFDILKSLEARTDSDSINLISTLLSKTNYAISNEALQESEIQFEKLNGCQARYQAILDGLTIKSQYQNEYFSRHQGAEAETFVTETAASYLKTVFIPEIGIPGLEEKKPDREFNLGKMSGNTFELLDRYKRAAPFNHECGTSR